MMIQINSDKHVIVNSELSGFIDAELNRVLGRFDSQLTRIEVHLSDVNSHKAGLHDKRCQLEARPAGLPPVSVSDGAATIEEAVRSSAGKMRRLLDTAFGRAADKR